MPRFETFHRGDVAWSADPFVTIQRRRMISLNAAAFLALGSPDSVELLFDPEARIVGLRGVPHTRDTAHHVRTSSSKSGPYLISATAFLRHHDIEVKVSTRWSAYLEDDVLCVDIDSAGTPVTSNRADTGRPRDASGD